MSKILIVFIMQEIYYATASEHVISCQLLLKVTSCYFHKVIRVLEPIYHLFINPIHRIGLIHK